MTDEEIQAQVAQDVAEFYQFMIESYKSNPKHAVSAITHGLAKYVSIVAKNPGAALQSIAKIIAETDYAAHRSEYFGYTLGAHETQKKPSILHAVPSFEEPKT